MKIIGNARLNDYKWYPPVGVVGARSLVEEGAQKLTRVVVARLLHLLVRWERLDEREAHDRLEKAFIRQLPRQ